jgi:hypothetical protein
MFCIYHNGSSLDLPPGNSSGHDLKPGSNHIQLEQMDNKDALTNWLKQEHFSMLVSWHAGFK